jgi:hypothetical protein
MNLCVSPLLIPLTPRLVLSPNVPVVVSALAPLDSCGRNLGWLRFGSTWLRYLSYWEKLSALDLLRTVLLGDVPVVADGELFEECTARSGLAAPFESHDPIRA